MIISGRESRAGSTWGPVSLPRSGDLRATRARWHTRTDTRPPAGATTRVALQGYRGSLPAPDSTKPAPARESLISPKTPKTLSRNWPATNFVAVPRATARARSPLRSRPCLRPPPHVYQFSYSSRSSSLLCIRDITYIVAPAVRMGWSTCSTRAATLEARACYQRPVRARVACGRHSRQP